MEISCRTDNILAKKINTLKQMAKIEKKLCTVDKALKRRGFAYCEFLASEIKPSRIISLDSSGRIHRVSQD